MTAHNDRALRPMFFWWLSLVLGALLLGAATTPAVALDNADNTCHPLDVVVLIDQSDSMRNVNDQIGQRFDAAQTIVDYLGNHAVWLCRDQDVTHRVTVIGFGDDPAQSRGTGLDNPYTDDIEIYLPNQVVPPSNDFQAWRSDRLLIEQPIEAAKNGVLGATDPYAGLLAARDQFAAWQAAPLGDLQRRRAVVVVTDGEPCLFARDCGQAIFYDIGPDMAALQLLTNPLDATFPWLGSDNEDSVHISLIAMSQRGGNLQQSFFDGWRDITTAHGGNVYSANAANTNMNTIVTDILGPIGGSGVEPVPCNTDVWVNPYTDNLVLIYSFGLVAGNQAGRAVITIDTGDEVLAVSGGVPTSDAVVVREYIPDGRNEYYVFQPPLPGRYNISYAGADPANCQSLMDIRVQRKSVTAAVVTPNDRSSYPATTPPSDIVGEPFRVEVYEAVGQDGQQQPLVEFPDYPIAVTATVTGAGGHQKEYSFRKVEDGVYESTELIQSPAVGDYDWTLRATVATPNPDEPEIVVLEADGRFTATEVTPFGFVITQPTDGARQALNTVQGARQLPLPIPVTVQLVDAAGGAADIETYLTDTSGLFTASLIQGDDIIETVPLTRVPGSASEFSGQLTNSASGAVVAAGDYTIEVQAAWSPDNYNPLINAPSVATAAVGLSQYGVVPLDLMITSPVSSTLHVDNWWASAQGELQPYEFHVQIIDATTGEAMALPDVLADPVASYQADVVPPSGNAAPFTLEPLSNENFQQLSAAAAGLGVDEAGDYQVKIDTASIPLQAGYAWAEPQKTVNFSRQDTTWTNPTTWRVILGAIAAVLALIIGYIFYKLIGGPSGTLSVVEYKKGRTETVIGGPWPLHGSPRTNRIRGEWLKENQVKVMKVKNARPIQDGAKRAVSIRAYDAQGLLVYQGTLHPGESDAFVEGDITYQYQ